LTYFVDSHVHLADEAFENEVPDIIARARASGARALVAIGESPDAARRSMALAREYPGFVFSTAGVHPHTAADWDLDRDGSALRELLDKGAVAVGECGLDYFYDNAPRALQMAALDAQMEIAADTGKPLVLHTREAEDDTVDFLKRAAARGVRGVLHCFTGSTTLAQAGISAGWYVSFSGIITFRKWTDTALLQAIPLDRLLVESDAPYLAPVPHRGKRNEPAFVARTLEHLAGVRGMDVHDLGEITIRNTMELFAIDVVDSDAFFNRSHSSP
jgi:TatD DNase family protein